MADTSVQPPYLDPSQYPEYLDLQRKQMLAQTLMGAFQQGNQTPSDWNSMRVVPKRSGLQNVAMLASALLAGKAMQGANQAQQKYFAGLYGGGDAPTTQPAQPITLAPPPADPNEQTVQPLIARNGQSFSQAVGGASPQQPPSSPLVPPGVSRGHAQALLSMMGPEKYGEMLAAQFKPAEIEAQLRAANIDPNSPLGHQIAQSALAKANYIAPIEVRGGNTALDPFTHQPIFTGPQDGIQTTWSNGQPQQSTIPGALTAQREAAAAKTAGTQSQTPIKLGTDENGRDIYGFPAPPAAGGPATNATAPGATASPATVESQQAGAKAGQAYATELSKNATGATEVRRSLSELKNLANQAGPSGLNEGKMKLGTYMIAAGMSPESVGAFLGVDVGALQAAQKQTATLAVNTIHSMTSRGTNFDLDTFMRNNPNMNMADPAAFNRVVDYMDNKAKQEVAKQKDFAEWKKGHSPDEWETGHTAHWLDKQNQEIDAGKSNSRPPLSSFWKN